MTDDDDFRLNKLTDNPYVGFKVKARDNAQNRATHDAFDEFSKKYTGHDYTIALRVLLENRKTLMSLADQGMVDVEDIEGVVQNILAEREEEEEEEEEDVRTF